ncbi:hypothetical protein H4R33_001846 [Dimargaris cristalligena]|nr:hypothetical protein H4R33_001846 [Dimargaris cristalligena]
MKLFSIALLTLAVPAVLTASLGGVPGVEFSSGSPEACPRMTCESHKPLIQAISKIMKETNADCKLVQSTLEKFAKENVQTTSPRTDEATYTHRSNALLSYLRANLATQARLLDNSEADPSQALQQLYRRDGAEDCDSYRQIYED